MENIGNLIKNMGQNKNNPQTRLINNITANQYKSLVDIVGNKIVRQINPTATYIIDDTNREALNQLYYYLIGSEKFQGDLYKGIMLVGGFGSGKTTLIKIFSEIYGYLNNRIFSCISAIQLSEIIKQEFDEENPKGHISYYEKRPLIIDEVGREAKKVMVYGTEYFPMRYLITMRYNSKGFTLGTTNFKLETLSSKEMYGEYVGERLLEMFNFIEVNGGSRRK